MHNWIQKKKKSRLSFHDILGRSEKGKQTSFFLGLSLEERKENKT